MAGSEQFDVDFSAFFDLALDLCCIATLDGYFKRVNRSFTNVLGYSTEELLATPFLELVHPEDHEATLGEVQRLSQGDDTVYFENRYRHKNGNWVWLSWTCPAPRTGSLLLYAVARDITKQKEAERGLRIRDSILTSMQNGLLITDPRQDDNPIIYCNEAFTKLTGYAAEESIGLNCRFLQGEDRHQPQLEELRRAIAEGRMTRVLLRNYRKDGSMFWNELVISPVCDEQDQLTHFVGLQYDITDIIRATQDRWRDVRERMESLAPRQREVMDHLVHGRPTKSIARELGISAKTVEVHRARVFEKMGVDSVVDLVRLVISSNQYWDHSNATV